MREIEIPEHVTFIDKRAFQNCWKLQEVHIPSNVTMMEEAFSLYYSSLAWVKFDAKVEKISKFMFRNCSMLQIIDFCGANTITKLSKVKIPCFLGTVRLPPNRLPHSPTPLNVAREPPDSHK